MVSKGMQEDLALEYVGFWARTGAAVIDTLLILLVTAPALLWIYGSDYYIADTGWVAGPADFLISWVLPALATLVFWTFKRATPGKMALSAEIVDARSGEPASTRQLVGRYFAYYLSAIPLLLGFIWVAFDDRKQGWHDKLAGTVVIRPRNRTPRQVEFER